MYEQQIQQIKEALRDAMQLLMSRGRPLTNNERNALARAMEHATQRILQLRAEEARQSEIEQTEAEEAQIQEQEPPPPPPIPPSGGAVPPLTPAPHESSNINAFRYDPQSKKLFLKFQGKYPSQNGPVYSYTGVPTYIYDIIRRGSIAPKTSGSNAWHTWKEGVTPSHGASVNALIKAGGFPYERLS